MLNSNYDCVVVGAGPGGGAAAAIVAEAGIDTLLIEREAVPRFHVGESLMPETYWPLQRLGLNDRVRSYGWQAKKSVQFVTHRGTESEPFFFRQHDDRECSTTWQVQRSEFDQLLFQRAGELGADCHDRTRLIDVLLDSAGKVTGVKVRDAQGQERTISTKVVIDASGQQSFIANKLGLREVNPDLKKVAIWGYFRGAVRGQGDNQGATIILNTESKESWFWFIPMANDITSVGCVGDSDYMLKGRGKPDQVFDEEMQRCPGLKRRLSAAARDGDIRTAKEFSYTTTASAGDGWVLVGDAWGFIDPVYSSGVFFALDMGVRAADAVVEGFRRSDLSANQLGGWVESFNEGAQWIRKLVNAFYTKEFSIGRFMKEHPEHRSSITDLLIGRVFSEGAGRMFEDMDASIERAKMRSPDAS